MSKSPKPAVPDAPETAAIPPRPDGAGSWLLQDGRWVLAEAPTQPPEPVFTTAGKEV